jgi:hemerythrin-like domain-containing protein
MSFQRQVSRALDDEHRANLEILGQVEKGFARSLGEGSAQDPDLSRLAGVLGRLLEHDIGRHFDFEERELFPRMEESGDGDMAMLLAEEHEAIRAVADELLPMTRAATSGTLDGAGWIALRRGALEIVERQVAHIQKETMALLPALEDLLGDDDDRELALAYASG